MATAELQKLMMERQGKVLEHQGKMQQIAAQHQADLELEDKKLLAQITVAEISTKAQSARERQQSYDEMQSQFHDQAHDVAMQWQQAAHQQRMQQQAAQQQQETPQQQAAQGQQPQGGQQ
jgi:hypothetical protein